MMEIIPAIDLIDAKAVRLTGGRFGEVTVYSDNPVAEAQRFEQAGLRLLHVVDLDGARTGEPHNLDVLKGITGATGLKVDFGGGVRSREALVAVLNAGAGQVSIGSLAVTNPHLLEEWIAEFGPDRFFLGVDVRDECLVYHGWQSGTNVTWQEFIARWMGSGVNRFFCTDVERDGLLAGPAVDLYKRIISHFPGIELVASGGVSSAEDLILLRDAGLSGVIVGKAIYEGRVDIYNLPFTI
ncbi:MAG: 1-(5-phosphoribosyl)-5-[(5-phosphoribosylamino)methylideneamino]imidazole-4-carboxamide isomerase [Bacteroidales bacterium]